MSIDFDCGVTANNVGVLPMALRHHLTICESDACKQDVKQELAKHTR